MIRFAFQDYFNKQLVVEYEANVVVFVGLLATCLFYCCTRSQTLRIITARLVSLFVLDERDDSERQGGAP
jgi:hypothetical protein